MITVRLKTGSTYRLKRPLEIRDEQSGTLKHFVLGGTVVKVRKLVQEEGRVWLEGIPLPVPISALERMVDSVA